MRLIVPFPSRITASIPSWRTCFVAVSALAIGCVGTDTTQEDPRDPELQGKLLSPNGEPVADADVSIARWETNRARDLPWSFGLCAATTPPANCQFRLTAKTDAQGQYSVPRTAELLTNKLPEYFFIEAAYPGGDSSVKDAEWVRGWFPSQPDFTARTLPPIPTLTFWRPGALEWKQADDAHSLTWKTMPPVPTERLMLYELQFFDGDRQVWSEMYPATLLSDAEVSFESAALEDATLTARLVASSMLEESSEYGGTIEQASRAIPFSGKASQPVTRQQKCYVAGTVGGLSKHYTLDSCPFTDGTLSAIPAVSLCEGSACGSGATLEIPFGRPATVQRLYFRDANHRFTGRIDSGLKIALLKDGKDWVEMRTTVDGGDFSFVVTLDSANAPFEATQLRLSGPAIESGFLELGEVSAY